MKDTVEIDTLIIGGGIIGLLTAYELHLKKTELEIAIIDKAAYVGDHTSGRNSGVMHAGIYYKTGSFKHKMCLEGQSLWKDLSSKLQIPYLNCGKFIIACNNDEAALLKEVKSRALENKVSGIRSSSGHELKELQKITYAVDAIFSRETGILDAAQACTSIEKELYIRDVPILMNTKAEKIERKKDKFIIETSNEIIHAQKLINCAGLGAVDIRKMLGLRDLENHFVKGCYLVYNKKLQTDSLIYPVPLKNLKGLGVHLTFDFQGRIKFGPDAEDVEEIDYAISENIIEKMSASINLVFKNIDKDLLSLDYSGIRPKILCEGELHTDFWIKTPEEHNINGYYEACGIESPGLTAAPAIAKYLVSKALNSSIK